MSTELHDQESFFSYNSGDVVRDVLVRPPPVFNPYARMDRGHKFIFPDEEVTVSLSGDIHGE
jgi:hypothetical protein